MKKPLLALLSTAFCAALLVLPSAAAARWHPAPTTTAWQWELQGKFELTPGASVYEIDGFEYSAANVKAIHRQGAKAICYLDVGSWEEYRPDASKFPKSSLGARYEGYPEERWLDIAHYGKFASIIKQRIALCARKGFDAVEPDNINGWENKSGFPLTAADQLRLAEALHGVVGHRLQQRALADLLLDGGDCGTDFRFLFLQRLAQGGIRIHAGQFALDLGVEKGEA